MNPQTLEAMTSFVGANLASLAVHIAGSLAIAVFLNLIPLGRLPFVPDWVALVLCFWSVREFRRVGMGWAFVLGLLMDVADGAVLGQRLSDAAGFEQ